MARGMDGYSFNQRPGSTETTNVMPGQTPPSTLITLSNLSHIVSLVFKVSITITKGLPCNTHYMLFAKWVQGHTRPGHSLLIIPCQCLTPHSQPIKRLKAQSTPRRCDNTTS